MPPKKRPKEKAVRRADKPAAAAAGQLSPAQQKKQLEKKCKEGVLAGIEKMEEAEGEEDPEADQLLQEAEADFRGVLELKADYNEAVLQLAVTHLTRAGLDINAGRQRDLIQRGIDLLRRVLELDTSHRAQETLMAHYELGTAFSMMIDLPEVGHEESLRLLAEGIGHFEKAISSGADDADTMLGYANALAKKVYAHVELGDPEEVIDAAYAEALQRYGITLTARDCDDIATLVEWAQLLQDRCEYLAKKTPGILSEDFRPLLDESLNKLTAVEKLLDDKDPDVLNQHGDCLLVLANALAATHGGPAPVPAEEVMTAFAAAETKYLEACDANGDDVAPETRQNVGEMRHARARYLISAGRASEAAADIEAAKGVYRALIATDERGVDRRVVFNLACASALAGGEQDAADCQALLLRLIQPRDPELPADGFELTLRDLKEDTDLVSVRSALWFQELMSKREGGA